MHIVRTLSAATLTAVLALSSTGCYGTTTVRTRGTYEVSTPSLEYIGPDVQVVADYDRPVFYSQNYYWQYDNGAWLRSTYHDRGYVRVNVVPQPILRIDRPYAYVRYHHRAMGNRRPVRVYHY